jgi:hypothetical protein
MPKTKLTGQKVLGQSLRGGILFGEFYFFREKCASVILEQEAVQFPSNPAVHGNYQIGVEGKGVIQIVLRWLGGVIRVRMVDPDNLQAVFGGLPFRTNKIQGFYDKTPSFVIAFAEDFDNH